MQSICIICSRYPTKVTPTNHVFVQQLVWSIADMGIDCTVIAPIPINNRKKFKDINYKEVEVTAKGNKINVYFPRYLSFGQKNIAGFNTSKLTTRNFYIAVKRTILKFDLKPQVLYGHFITPAGITVSRLGKEFEIPSFIAYGESTLWSIENYGIDKVREELKNITGVVAVSSHNKEVLIKNKIIQCSKIKVFVNAIRSERFYPRNKEEARKKFNFNKDFIVAFVGQYTERKGILRLCEAVKDMNDIGVIYGGKGAMVPHGENILYSGIVRPEDMPYFLSAADIFVLPTQNEGCCNAILEAMACGLPIISSDLPFNYDVLDSNNSILINPNSVKQIREAILKLKNNSNIREDMRKNTLIKVSNLTYEKRAAAIVEWIDSLI